MRFVGSATNIKKDFVFLINKYDRNLGFGHIYLRIMHLNPEDLFNLQNPYGGSSPLF